MATNPADIEDPNLDPNAVPDDTGSEGEPESNGEDSPYATLAKDMGWMPKDQFQGPPEDWKDPETFIREGREIQRDTSRELKAVRSQLDTIARTSASVVEEQVKERVEGLTAKFNKAVEDGDNTQAFKISREIDSAISTVKTPTGPSPEAQSFAERNASWFNKPGNEYATSRAVEICNTLAAQGYTDHGTQLRIAEQRMRQEMPQLFGKGMNGKPAPSVNNPGSRSAGPSNRAKGFSDMPKAAQDIARDMVDRGVIKDTESYARNYFANLEGTK